MYAILQQSGHQYRVSPGDRLVVDRLTAEVGAMVALEPVVLVAGDDGTQVGTPVVDGARVAAVVVSHSKGAKIRVYKYKPKKRYRRTHGHRSLLTELRIEAVLAAGEALPEPRAAVVKVKEAPAKPARPRGTKPEPAAEAPSADETTAPETGAETAAAEPSAKKTTAQKTGAAGKTATAEAPKADVAPDAPTLTAPEPDAPKKSPRTRAKKADTTESSTPAADGGKSPEA